MISLLFSMIAAQAPLVTELTQFNEATEGGLHVEESWGFTNRSGSPIPVEQMGFSLPDGARKVRISPQTTGFVTGSDGRSVIVNEPLGPGEQRQLQLQYELPVGGGGRVTAGRLLPFPIEAARFVFEASADTTLAASEKVVRTTRSVNGVDFVLWDMAAMPANKRLTLTWAGIPSHAEWPKWAALALVAGIVVLTVYALRTRRAPGAGVARPTVVLPLSGAAKKERLVRAVELLDRDHEAGKLDADQHARRRTTLVTELAVVLREIELDRR